VCLRSIFKCLQEFSENREQTLMERGVIAEKQSELPFVKTGEAMCNICYCPCDAEKECGWLSCKHQVSKLKSICFSAGFFFYAPPDSPKPPRDKGHFVPRDSP
jgi:hypothetical protein